MALDIFKLSGSVTIDTGKAEAGLKRIDASAKKTADSLSTLGSGKPINIGANLKDLSAINSESLRARTSLEKIGDAGKTGLDKLKASLTLTGNGLKVVRETVESVSSEIIESFGVDGDVANLLANNLNRVKLSSIAAGGAIAGLVIGVGVLTTAMAGVGAEISKASQLTGLNTDQVQKYQAAATAAGAQASAFTDAIKDLRDRAKEAAKGNIEISAAFEALGVSASTSALNAAPAFEKLLDILQQVPDAQTRITIAQRVLGDVNDDTLAGILALTDANGQLRDRVRELSVALDQQAVKELKQLNQEWDILTTKLGVFGKKIGLGVINTLEFIGLALAGETEKMNQTSAATSKLSDVQAAAAFAFGKTTGEVLNQTSAISKLTAELASVQISAAQNVVSERIAQIAVKAKTAREAVKEYKSALASDQGFAKTSADAKRFAENQKAIDEFRNPKAATNKPRVLSELEQLTKQAAEAKKDLEGFRKFGSEEFKLRIKLEDSRQLKSQLEEIFKIRRSLGEVVAAPFPTTRQGVEDEIARLEAFKTARELMSKQDIVGPLRDSAAASAKALGETFTELDRLIKDALPQSIELTTEEALVQNELYQALLRTSPILAEQYRIDAQGADAKIRSLRATEAFTGLQDRLNDQLQSFRNLTVEQSIALELQTDRYKDLTAVQREELLAQARQIDAQSAFRDQMEQSRQALEQFADTTKGLFETLFNEGPKAFFDNLLSTLKRTLSRMAAEIATSAVMRALGFQAGGAASATSAIGIAGRQPGGFLGQIFGGASTGGGFLTGGFAGGNPAAAALGGGSGTANILGSVLNRTTGAKGLGGLLSKIPLIGGLFGGGKKPVGPEMIGGLPVFKNLPVQLSGMPNIGGAASAATGDAGKGILGALGFSNPISAIITGGLFGASFLGKLFQHDYLKDYRNLIRGEYAVDVKDKSLLQQVQQIGQQKYGKNFGRFEIETVRLPDVRELLFEYAQATGQKGNSKLFSAAIFQDPFSAVNLMKREFGGPVFAGMPVLVGERRPEVFIPNTNGQIIPSVDQYKAGRGSGGGGDWQAMQQIVEELRMAIQHLYSMPPDQVVSMAKPGTITGKVRQSFLQRDSASIDVRNLVAKR